MSTEGGTGGRCGERNKGGMSSGGHGLRWREGLMCLVNTGHESMHVYVWVCVCVVCGYGACCTTCMHTL